MLNDSFRAHDDISNLPLDGLERRLVNKTTRPTGFRTAVIGKSLLIYTLVTNDLVPSISACVTVSSHLLITLCYNVNVLPQSKYNDIVHGSLQTMPQLLNVMAKVKAYADEPDMTSQDISLQTAVMSLQIAGDKAEDEEQSLKLSCIIEQLELIAGNKYGHYYSR